MNYDGSIMPARLPIEGDAIASPKGRMDCTLRDARDRLSQNPNFPTRSSTA